MVLPRSYQIEIKSITLIFTPQMVAMLILIVMIGLTEEEEPIIESASLDIDDELDTPPPQPGKKVWTKVSGYHFVYLK